MAGADTDENPTGVVRSAQEFARSLADPHADAGAAGAADPACANGAPAGHDDGGDDDELSPTNTWVFGRSRSALLPALRPPLQAPAAETEPPPGPGSAAPLRPSAPATQPSRPSAPPGAEAVNGSPLNAAFARGSGMHPNLTELVGKAAAERPGRVVALSIGLGQAVMLAAAWMIGTGLAAWAGAAIAMHRNAPKPPAPLGSGSARGAVPAAPVIDPLPPPEWSVRATPGEASAAAAPRPADPGPIAGPSDARIVPAGDDPHAACPEGMVRVAPRLPVCIDRFEAPGEGEAPTVQVTRSQAAERCRAAGKRLCAPAEWEQACRGERGASYPFGPSAGGDACHLRTGRAPVAAGRHPACRSASGAFDMSGNVSEWTSEGGPRGASSVDGGDGRCSRPRPEPRGGSAPDVGFRCCVDVEG